MDDKRKHGILAIFSVFLVWATVFLPEKATNLKELSNLRFGHPVAFISQDFSNYDDSFSFFRDISGLSRFLKTYPLRTFLFLDFWFPLLLSLRLLKF